MVRWQRYGESGRDMVRWQRYGESSRVMMRVAEKTASPRPLETTNNDGHGCAWRGRVRK
jgi:hypothetical protein